MKFKEDFTPEEVVEEAVVEEAPVEVATPVVEKKELPKVEAKVDFVSRKLKAINLMTNEAKKRGLAERVMRNK